MEVLTSEEWKYGNAEWINGMAGRLHVALVKNLVFGRILKLIKLSKKWLPVCYFTQTPDSKLNLAN